MIKFTLKCEKGHKFESWFQSSEAFDKLKLVGMVTCTMCGSSSVNKGIMAPVVRTKRSNLPARPCPATPDGALSAPANDQEAALAALKKQVEDNSEYVGTNFASQARDMHDGLAPERAIYGEANAEEARKLIEDGVRVTPLPFITGRKSN